MGMDDTKQTIASAVGDYLQGNTAAFQNDLKEIFSPGTPGTKAQNMRALDEAYYTDPFVQGLYKAHPDAARIVTGDFDANTDPLLSSLGDQKMSVISDRSKLEDDARNNKFPDRFELSTTGTDDANATISTAIRDYVQGDTTAFQSDLKAMNGLGDSDAKAQSMKALLTAYFSNPYIQGLEKAEPDAAGIVTGDFESLVIPELSDLGSDRMSVIRDMWKLDDNAKNI
jgi:hypothetical protein